MQKKPIYITIKESMVNLICANAGKENFQLPSEQQICTKYKVSRITAKRVLNDLVDEGLVYRIQGKGTFISPALTKGAISMIPNQELLHNTRVFVIFPTVESNYIRQILWGIVYTLREYDITPQILFSCQESDYEEHLIRNCINSYCSGLILYPVDYNNSHKDLFELYKSKKVPVLYVDRIPEKGHLSYIIPDHYATSRQVTEFLISKGYRRICFIISGSNMLSSVGQRMSGFNHALKDASLPFASYNFLNIAETDYEEIKIRLLSFFREYPDTDGLIVPEGIVSSALAEVLDVLGKKPIQDIGIATYDNEIPPYLNPLYGKTLVVDQRPQMLGRTAVENLLSLILRQQDVSETVFPSAILNKEIFQ